MALFGQIPANSAIDLSIELNVYVATSGGTYTIPDSVGRFIIDPASTLTTFTLTMPANPTEGFILRIVSSKAITLLTVSANSGQSIVGAPASLLLGGYCTFLWVSAKSTWYRCG